MTFTDLYNNYYNLVSKWVSSEVGPNKVEDVVQEVFMNVWRRKGFEGRSKVQTWLYRITRNQLIDRNKTERSVETTSMNVGWEDGEEREYVNLSHSDTPDMEAEKTETPLTEKEMDMIALFGVGCTYSQIASIHNKTEKSVQSTISQAKAKWKRKNSTG